MQENYLFYAGMLLLFSSVAIMLAVGRRQASALARPQLQRGQHCPEQLAPTDMPIQCIFN